MLPNFSWLQQLHPTFSFLSWLCSKPSPHGALESISPPISASQTHPISIYPPLWGLSHSKLGETWLFINEFWRKHCLASSFFNPPFHLLTLACLFSDIQCPVQIHDYPGLSTFLPLSFPPGRRAYN